MLAKRVIPCLDVDQGRVVKGTNFVNLRDAGDPVEVAARYEKEGADELVFLGYHGQPRGSRYHVGRGATDGRADFHAVDGRRRDSHDGRHSRAC